MNISLQKKHYYPVLMSLILILILIIVPTGFENAVIYRENERCKAKIVAVNNSNIVNNGLIKTGEQKAKVRLQNGIFKDREVEGVNLLTGSLQTDKIFKVGDEIFVMVTYENKQIISVNMVDYYRLDKEVFLAGIVIALLIIFAGWMGLRAIVSFVLAVLTLWKVLIPCYLKGFNPILVGLGIIMFLTIFIILLVYGLDKKAFAASGGAVLGIITTGVLGIMFSGIFQIDGSVMDHAESLLYSGYEYLNLTQIFIASIFIGASGAVMDLAVDITSAVHEVTMKCPDITVQDAIKSGMVVGRAAVGTMSTTLLLAYSGSSVALLMVFMAQGTPMDNIFNYKYIAAEILNTLVGSFGLITVAPFTAITSGIVLAKKKNM